MKKQIYLDNCATTKIRPEALERYVEASSNEWGNPSSLHNVGADAENVIKASKQTILYTFGEKDSEVIFTASGSEANNLAIIGRAMAKERYKSGAKIISTAGEHSSVRRSLEHLCALGFKVAYVPTHGGEVDLEALKKELTRDVILVSVMMVNNETGAVYDLPKIARLTRSLSPDAAIHVDATQGYMKIPFTKSGIGADMITVSSHKIEGPKGIGALIVGKSLLKERGLSPIIYGGGQELGLRSGTENVPAIAAFAEAARIGHASVRESCAKLEELRKYLLKRLSEDAALTEIRPTLPKMHAPHILNVTLPGIKSETMLHFLSSRGIYVSSGSACSSNSAHASSALTAYGHTAAEADCSIRISFGRLNGREDVDALCEALAEGLSRLARIK